MNKVICPNCKKEREVEIRKPWMIGEPPFEKLCRSCCQKGKIKTQEHRDKLSEAVKKLQTAEVLEAKREFMLNNPEFWKGKLKEGGAEIHSLGKTHSEETKKKIGKGVRETKAKNKEDEENES
jgi:hypothetical protein